MEVIHECNDTDVFSLAVSASLPCSRMLIVSNSLPICKEQDGTVSYNPTKVAGIVPAVQNLVKSGDINEFVFIGHYPGNVPIGNAEQLKKLACVPVNTPKETFTLYYEGFCKSSLWPLLHYRLHLVKHNMKSFEAYEKVNKLFAEVILCVCKPGDIIWIHDYNLMLLPTMLRERIPRGVPIGFFFHVPFPSSELFRVLPNRAELLHGVLGSDLIGLQTFESVRHFESTVSRLLGAECTPRGIESPGGHFVRIGVFSGGIDFETFEKISNKASTKTRTEHLRHLLTDKYVIVSRDRVDEIEGVPLKLHAIEKFLTKYPQYKGKFVYFQIYEPQEGEEESEENKSLQREVNEIVGRLNGVFGKVDYVPIEYVHKHLSLEEICALYSVANAALNTPIRDGLHLVAHEYVACQNGSNPGVLVLSEFTGAARCLAGARLVNPFDTNDFVEAIHEALSLHEHDIDMVGTAYSRSTKDRLFLLDYDGTLSPLARHPKMAVPSSQVISVLTKLSKTPRNKVYVISGRDGNSLESWLGHLDVGLACEHGCFFRPPGEKEWVKMTNEDTPWRQSVVSLMEDFTDRTPGSFVELKQINVAWHYRNSDPDYGSFQARELVMELQAIANKFPVDIIRGKKAIEVKPQSVNKGNIVQHILSQNQDVDFVFCIGDDKTDEDMFAHFCASPKNSYFTSCVMTDTKRTTQAKYWVETYNDVLDILTELVSLDDKREHAVTSASPASSISGNKFLLPPSIPIRQLRRNSLLSFGASSRDKKRYVPPSLLGSCGIVQQAQHSQE